MARAPLWQSLASQDAQLHAAGCAKVYSEKISGARSDRAELAKVLKRLAKMRNKGIRPDVYRG